MDSVKGCGSYFCDVYTGSYFTADNIVMVFNRIAPYVATALLVIFQPEIRRALEQLGTNHLFELFFRFLAQKIKLQKMQMILLMRLFVHPLAWGVQRQEH